MTSKYVSERSKNKFDDVANSRLDKSARIYTLLDVFVVQQTHKIIESSQ